MLLLLLLLLLMLLMLLLLQMFIIFVFVVVVVVVTRVAAAPISTTTSASVAAIVSLKPCAHERIGRVAPTHEANCWAVFCYEPCPQTSGSSISCQLIPRHVTATSLARLFLTAAPTPAGCSQTIESRSGEPRTSNQFDTFPPGSRCQLPS